MFYGLRMCGCHHFLEDSEEDEHDLCYILCRIMWHYSVTFRHSRLALSTQTSSPGSIRNAVNLYGPEIHQ